MINPFNLFKRKKNKNSYEPTGYSLSSYAGRRVTPQQSLQLTSVYTCVRVLAESVGMLPCFLYQETGNGRRIKASKERLYSLLHLAPNRYMTPQEFWETVITSLCLRGNFYAYKVKALGEVVELLPLPPENVQPKLSEKWEPVYEVTFFDGTKDALTQDEIWHIRTFTTDSLVGLSPITCARKAVELGLATEEHGSQLFTNGTITSGVLQTDSILTDEAYKRLKENFQESHQGLANAHKPMILEAGLKWNNISMSAEDAQFLETRKFQLEEICRIFRVPMHMVQNTDRATYSNIENLGLGFVTYTLVPYLTRIEQRINAGLINESKRENFYAKFNVGALLRGDMKSRYESYATGINWGILSPNECRDLEERNPRDGGDIYLTPMNMTTNPQDDRTNDT